jgi:hypothetical protein
MTQSETIPLRCPSCGSSETVGAKEVRFGLHFTCRHCATPSVLILGSELYITRPGEHVCSACGRVSPRDTKFCQCGRAMLRQCNSHSCTTQIPIDHEICDCCGWPQSLAWDSAEGRQRKIEMALELLKETGDRSAALVVKSVAPPEIGIPVLVTFAKTRLAEGAAYDYGEVFKYIAGYGEAARPALVTSVVERPTWNGVRGLASYGECAVPAIIKFLEAGEFRISAAEAARDLGPAAAPAIPALIALLETEQFTAYAEGALRAIGPAVIPHLQPLTGLPRKAPMRQRAESIIGYVRRPVA